MSFPLDVSGYKPLKLDSARPELATDVREQLARNVDIVRDTIVFYTAVAGIRGFGGHTGGAYNITPEVLIADGFMRNSDSVYPAYFDEAGHRVAIQYAMSAFNGSIPFEKLLHYREEGHDLYGHPELDLEHGVKFSSGRLGHMWAFINGVAMAHPDKSVVMFGSDGSQMEGNDAEAARFAVAQDLNVKLFIDDNNVTISGHPSDYLPGFNITNTLEGHGLAVDEGDGEDLDGLFARMCDAMKAQGPAALVNKRLMAPGIPGIEGSNAGHDVIKKDPAIEYLAARGHDAAVAYLNDAAPTKSSTVFIGSTKEFASNRTVFGEIVNGILDGMPKAERKRRVLVIDSDLEGSTGIKNIREAHPEVFVNGGVQERGNYSVAAGFGFEEGRQGIFSTFAAFLEMIISEATMARLNESNVLCHFSHSGVDDMADNTCHFGVNNFFADAGLPEGDTTRLYFPADAAQLKAVVESIWDDPGARYVFTTRSKVPYICNNAGNRFFEDGYAFTVGKDEVIREGSAGYVVSYGDVLYRALDAVERARADGIDVGLINKPTLNVVDDDMMNKAGSAPFVLLAESQNLKTGLGVRYGTWLLERGLSPKYTRLGVTKPGAGGTTTQIPHQGLAPDDILAKIRQLTS